MGTLSALLAFSEGIRWIPSQRFVDAELWYFLLLSVWTSCWTNSRDPDAGDLRRHQLLISILTTHCSRQVAPRRLKSQGYLTVYSAACSCYQRKHQSFALLVLHEGNPQGTLTMMTSSNGNIFRVTGHLAGNSPVTGEFPAQRPVTRSFDVFFRLRLNKRLTKQWWGWWFLTPSRPLWRHWNERRVSNKEGVSSSRGDRVTVVQFKGANTFSPRSSKVRCNLSLTNPHHKHTQGGWFNSLEFAYNAVRWHIDGLVQERRNSSALAMGLRLSFINPSTYKNVSRL